MGNRRVYIEGTVPYRHPGPPTGLALAERPYGPFNRTFNLPVAGGVPEDGTISVIQVSPP